MLDGFDEPTQDPTNVRRYYFPTKYVGALTQPSQWGRYSYTLVKEGKSPALTVLRCYVPGVERSGAPKPVSPLDHTSSVHIIAVSI